MRVRGLGGPIEVRLVRQLEHEGKEAFGLFRIGPRQIEIDANLPEPAREATLWHEWIHGVLFDGGMQDVSSRLQERFCDLLSSGLMNAGVRLPRMRKGER